MTAVVSVSLDRPLDILIVAFAVYQIILRYAGPGRFRCCWAGVALRRLVGLPSNRAGHGELGAVQSPAVWCSGDHPFSAELRRALAAWAAAAAVAGFLALPGSPHG